MLTLRHSAALVPFMAMTAVSCGPDASDLVSGVPGEPLPGLTDVQRARFEAGRSLFDHEFTAEEGLGPLFNDRRCSSCHDVPALGGTGVEPAVKATRFEPPNRCDLLETHGGDTFQTRATAALQALGITREIVPPVATARTSLMPPSLFGLGLVEVIPDETILRRADPDDDDGDGISGRAVVLPGGRLGRFGRKGGVATVRDFIETALRGEMGLTTPDNPRDEGVNGQPLPAGTDPAADPEVSGETIDLLDAFVRYLAPPEAFALSGTARDTAMLGERVFRQVGCAECHVPTMRTASAEDAAFDRKTVALYSDLLLHDMGPDLADICTPGAAPAEYLTARLMGLRFRVDFLHDGRAGSPFQAINLHGGEAAAARDAYASLPAVAQEALLRFLATL